MKKIKGLILVSTIIMTILAVLCFGASAESEIRTQFDSKSGILYVEGQGELKNLYCPSWYEFEEDDCEHDERVLCDWCLEYRVKNIVIGEGITSIDHCHIQ